MEPVVGIGLGELAQILLPRSRFISSVSLKMVNMGVLSPKI
jgi:hypothetical protein